MAHFLFISLVVCLLLSSSSRAEFNSGLASVVNQEIEWDYSDGPNGPAHWAELSEDWATCGNGTNQGPIDVTGDLIALDSHLDVPNKVYYSAGAASVYADGKILEAQWDGGIYNVHEFDYVTEKVVFHSPSEHTYFGKRFDLEVQIYHTHPTEGVAVNVIMFEEGDASPWLQQFMQAIPTGEILGQSGETYPVLYVDGSGVNAGSVDWSRYYRYLGSLLTPPCNESPYVVFSLLKSPLTASKEQIARVREALLNKPNTRPIQEINKIRVYYPMYVDT